MGCYLSPGNNSTIKSVVAALKELPRGAKLLVAGDFNMKLSDPEGDWRGEDIAAELATEGLKDTSEHFLLRRHSWCRGRRTWRMIRAVRPYGSYTRRILGMDRRLFWYVLPGTPGITQTIIWFWVTFVVTP